jgi:hypothetical protein
MGLLTTALRGAAAGAAGTTALNAITYLDMAVRGRPSSSTPEQTVEAGARLVGARVPGEGDARQARLTGLGALTGLAAGFGAGVGLAALRSAGWRHSAVTGGLVASVLAMLAANGPMAALGVTDPRTWGAEAWAADVVPHVGYGLVTAAVLDALEG